MNDDTCLWRQVFPGFFKNRQVTSQVFDTEELSFSDGDQVTPEESWAKHTKTNRSIGVVAVKVSECTQLGVYPVPDCIPGVPEHVIANYEKAIKSRKGTAKLLATIANCRGWKHNPCNLPALVPKPSR